MAENYEAVALEPKARLNVRPSEKYEPGNDEVLIRTSIVSVSPFEAKMQQRAMYPVPYPANFGLAFAGTIEATGSAVHGFTAGEPVAVFGGGLRRGDLRRGAHQRFVICDPSEIAKVGPDADPKQTSTTISNITTVVPALSIKAGLDRPSTKPNPANKDKKVLIYGGTTQLGRLSVQYAKEAGYSVVTTTSPRHKDATAALSPAAIIDHTAPAEKVAEEIIAHGPYLAVFDTASQPPTQAILAPVMRENAKKGQTNTVLATGPALTPHEGVEFSMNSYPSILSTDPKGPELNKWLFEEYFPGLYNGTYGNVDTAVEMVPGGLNSLQSIYDRVMSVSGKKLVYSPWDE